MERYSEKKKRGCPTCAGVHPGSCLRCHGKTLQCDWYATSQGWVHALDLMHEEQERTARQAASQGDPGLDPSQVDIETGIGGSRGRRGVRVTHRPTGLQVSCDSHADQAENQERAMSLLAHCLRVAGGQPTSSMSFDKRPALQPRG